ncbi:DUF6275 family protein [Thomasclavelia ramosa]|uniref:DUF6275 family protein n=1 Tax=Thomasclavelia ramosa TaxID=1547 RepID=UPI0022E63AC6|nr:DUF6275 family protein [Thomasclavelia ramosa]
MDSKKFIKLCIDEVVKYTNEHLDKTDKKQITKDDVFVVWSCKTLQNNKALLSTNIFDGMYYECTYNGDKNELYFDAYKKGENRCIKLGG